MAQTDGTHPATYTIDVAGRRTQYLAAGTGPALVLLHGIGDSAADWHRVIPRLAEHYHVYALNFPGHGESAPLTEGYSATGYAHFVNDFFHALGLENAVVVGHSLGGLAALCFALSAPSHVRALVLVDSAGLGREVNVGLRLISTQGYGDLVMGWVGTPLGNVQRILSRVPLLFANPTRVSSTWLAEQYRLAQEPDFRRATLAELRSQVGLAGQRQIVLDQLPQLAMPTLLIWGAYDQLVPLDHARVALTRLKRGQLAVIPDCGHLPQIEQPDRFVTAISNFLKT